MYSHHPEVIIGNTFLCPSRCFLYIFNKEDRSKKLRVNIMKRPPSVENHSEIEWNILNYKISKRESETYFKTYFHSFFGVNIVIRHASEPLIQTKSLNCRVKLSLGLHKKKFKNDSICSFSSLKKRWGTNPSP